MIFFNRLIKTVKKVRKERVAVTGGAGFIGSNLSRELVARGYEVTIIDNLSTGKLRNIKDIRRQVNFIRGDIRDIKTLQQAFRGLDFVLHQAALPSVPRSINDPAGSHDVNVNGTFNVLLAAGQQKVRKVVLASSSSIYGNRKNFGTVKIKNKREAMKPMPLSPYAVNKLIGEEYAKVFAHIFQVPTVCLRYFNVFGPYQDPHSEYSAVIPKFIKLLIADQRPLIHGNGLQSRDFTYIDNVVRANILAMTSDSVGHGETMNIACGASITLRQLVAGINRIIKKNIDPKFGPRRAGDVKHSSADIRKAKRLIGYTPHIDFDDGLRRTIAWYQDQFHNIESA